MVAASARHLLAMKARAARQRDIADIVTLARLLGTGAEQVVLLTEQVFGGEALSERSRAVLGDLDDTLRS